MVCFGPSDQALEQHNCRWSTPRSAPKLSPMDVLTNGPETAPYTVVFAHGAGIGMDAPFMMSFAEGLAANGFRVVRFEFPYMSQRRESGTRRPPDRPPALLEAFREAIALAAAPPGRLVLAGKSMGGRMATMIADQVGAAAVLVFGYPFHPPKKPENLRTEHLKGLATPTLICQGERDPFGTQEEVAAFGLSGAIKYCWLEDGDHDFKPRKTSGATHQTNWIEAIEASSAFLDNLKSG